MANEKFIKGSSSGVVSVYDDAASAYKPVACLTDSSLATSQTVIEASTKCDPGVVYKEIDQFTYDISFDGKYIDTTSATGDTSLVSHDWLLAKQMAKEKIQWRLDTGLADTTYYGRAVLSDGSANFPDADLSNFSFTFNGDGNITTTDPMA